MRKNYLSLLDSQKLEAFRKRKMQQDYVGIFCDFDKTKIKKVMKQVTQANARFKKAMSKCSIMDLDYDGLLDYITKNVHDDMLMLGFINLFQKVQELKMVEIEKENTKIQDEIKLYKQGNKTADRGVYRLSDDLICPTRNQNPWCGLSEAIRQFQDKHGIFQRIPKKTRLMCAIIDSTYQKLNKK